MTVLLLTSSEADQLRGQFYTEGVTFNPVQDGSTPPNWVISQEEANECTNNEFMWVRDLPKIEWVKPIEEDETN